MTVIFNCYICIVLRSRPFKFLGFARIFVHTKQMSDYLLFCISRVIFSRNFGDKIYLFRKKHNPAYKSNRRFIREGGSRFCKKKEKKKKKKEKKRALDIFNNARYQHL